jgi:hypothetical protein
MLGIKTVTHCSSKREMNGELIVKIIVLWHVTPYTVVEISLCFGGTHCLHLVSIMLMNFHETTWCHVPEDYNYNSQSLL